MNLNGKLVIFLVVMFFFFSQISYAAEKTYNDKPFINLISPPMPFNGDRSGPGNIPWPEGLINSNPFGDPFKILQKPSVPEKKENRVEKERKQGGKKIFQETSSGNDIASGIFSYTGFSWNGCDYTGILSYSGASRIVRKGDKLKEGYRVFSLNDREIIMFKDGKKITVKLGNGK